MARISIAKYIELPSEMRARGEYASEQNVAADLCTAVKMWVTNDLEKGAPATATTPSDSFRKEKLYTEEMDDFLFSYLPHLQPIFTRYSPNTLQKGIRSGEIDMDVSQWLEFVEDLGFVDDDFTVKKAVSCFIMGKVIAFI